MSNIEVTEEDRRLATDVVWQGFIGGGSSMAARFRVKSELRGKIAGLREALPSVGRLTQRNMIAQRIARLEARLKEVTS